MSSTSVREVVLEFRLPVVEISCSSNGYVIDSTRSRPTGISCSIRAVLKYPFYAPHPTRQSLDRYISAHQLCRTPPLFPLWSNDCAEPRVPRRSRELRRPLRTHKVRRLATHQWCDLGYTIFSDGAASVLPPQTWTSVRFFVTMRVRLTPKWACSAVGSAPEWHSGGHRFDPGQVHQLQVVDSKLLKSPKPLRRSNRCVYVVLLPKCVRCTAFSPVQRPGAALP